MTAGRLFAGSVVKRLSPIALLIAAACLSAIGLLGLSVSRSPVPTFITATVFAVGICYFWPTMLGVTSERFPAGGALLLAIIGGAGNLSVAVVLPIMGRIYDARGPEVVLRDVVLLPLILIAVFSAIWLHDRSIGGYRIMKLSSNISEE